MRVEGAAIHSGVRCTVTLHRAEGPIRFRRAKSEIEARIGNVASAERATSLAAGGAQVHLVEHLLAALRARGFYEGVLVEASHDELPILDGSALEWLPAIEALGAPPPPPPALVLAAPLTVTHAGGTLRMLPGAEHLDYGIEFDHPAIGTQRWSGGPERYEELLAARTFGMLAEWEALKERGLALGASERHAIVFDDVGPVRPLRHPDEPVRHKALDALGDFALLGRPLHARLSIHRGSHALNHEAVRAVVSALAPGRGA